MLSTTSQLPCRPSQPPGDAPEDHSQPLGDSNEQKSNQSVDNMDTAQAVLSDNTYNEQDVSNTGLVGGGGELQKDDPKGQVVSIDTVKLGKRVSRAIEILELQIEATLAEHRADIPRVLDIQIENLRKLGRELRGENESGNIDENYYR